MFIEYNYMRYGNSPGGVVKARYVCISGVGSVPATPAMAGPLFCLQIDGYWIKPYVSYGYADGFINTGNSI